MPLDAKVKLPVALLVICMASAQAFAQSSSSSADAGPRQSMPLAVDIKGNRALLDSVLRWVMDLPERGPPTPEMARRAERRLRGFFHETGYDLARVRVFAFGDTLHVLVDEGRLDRIFITGASGGQALRLQVDLRLPGDVYNRFAIAEELERLEEKYGIEQLDAELMLLEPSPSTIFQLQDFVDLLDAPGSPAELWQYTRGRYALRVHATAGEAPEGLDFGARYLLPWGLQAGVSYTGSELLLDGDRYRAFVQVSGLRDQLLTEVEGTARWSAPPVSSDSTIRPVGEVRNRLRSFERESLGLDDYFEFDSDAVVSLGWNAVEELELSVGLGYAYERIFNLDRSEETPDYVTAQSRHYPLGRLGLSWLIDRGLLRRDKQHELDLEFELYQVEAGTIRRLEFDYQKVWEFGFQDLFWRVDATTITGGGVQWQDEEPIASTVLRSVAGDEEFARNMGQSGLEYRLSLYRDIFKISGSAGAGVARLLDRQTRRPFIAFFASSGPGLHLRLLDNFEASAYYSVGWRAGYDFDGQFSLSLIQIY